MKPDHGHFEHLLYATKWSMAGLKAAWSFETAFRIEVIASCFIIPLGLYFGESSVEKVLLCGAWLLVMVVELLNSGIEATVDRISLEHHELSGRAKDLGSAAVFMSNIICAGTWSLILFT